MLSAVSFFYCKVCYECHLKVITDRSRADGSKGRLVETPAAFLLK